MFRHHYSFEMGASKKPQSLAYIILRTIGIRLAILIALGSIGIYWYNQHNNKKMILKQLDRNAGERAERENFIYSLIEINAEYLARVFTESLKVGLTFTEKDFNKIFEQVENGSFRNRDYQNPQDTQVFIPRSTVLTKELKKELVFNHKLLTIFGYVWQPIFLNVWAVAADDKYAMSFTPKVPHSLHFLPPNFSFQSFESIRIGLPEENPKGKPRWSGPFFDRTLKKWIISLNYPVLIEGKKVLSFGMDFDLEKLIRRTSENYYPGSYNIVFDESGRLISHPDLLSTIEKTQGHYYLQKSEEKLLNQIFELTQGRDEAVKYLRKENVFVAAKKIDRANWWFVMVYPDTTMRLFSIQNAIIVTVMGIIGLLLEIFFTLRGVKKTVLYPIRRLIFTVDQIASGNTNKRVKIKSSKELNHLGESFNLMVEKVAKRDRLLQEQAKNLEGIVEQRTKELDVERANAYNASKMAMLGDISGRIAHEINNPLAIITTGAESVIRQIAIRKDPEKMVPNLDKILKNSERISEIIKEMRSFYGDMRKSHKEYYSVREIINSAVILFRETLRNDAIELIVHDFEDMGIFCNEFEVGNILLNLIENSADAIRDSSIKRIDIRVRRVRDHIYIEVEDTGRGIDPEIQDRIMEPFFTTKEVGEGLGLGLFISSGLAKANGAELYFDKKSFNTKFVVRFSLIPH